MGREKCDCRGMKESSKVMSQHLLIWVVFFRDDCFTGEASKNKAWEACAVLCLCSADVCLFSQWSCLLKEKKRKEKNIYWEAREQRAAIHWFSSPILITAGLEQAWAKLGRQFSSQVSGRKLLSHRCSSPPGSGFARCGASDPCPVTWDAGHPIGHVN